MSESFIPPPAYPLRIAGVDGDPLRLEELVDRRALADMLVSFEGLFRIPVRVVAASGTTLAGSSDHAPLCALLNQSEEGSQACRAVLDEAEARAIEGGAGAHRCFTGAMYHVVPIEYDRQVLGRIVLGPYVPEQIKEPPSSLLSASRAVEPEHLQSAWSSLVRAEPGMIERLGRHLATELDVIIFSGHKALLTSQMHIASIQESYRELCEKNERLEEAYERLQELDRLKSNFLATVSHELRTPLTSIMGYGEMLGEGIAGPLNPEQREFVDTIRAKSEQLLSLIMSLLDLSKLESGTLAMRAGRLSISTVVVEAATTLTPTALKKGVKLETDAPADLPPIMGDPSRLRQIFVNLLDNAVKFTPPQGTVRIVARGTLEEPTDEPGVVLVAPLRQAIEVRVIDTGIGIPAAEREKIFDPFYQVDQSSTREYGGAGLGLSIVKRLVEAHQGTIRIEDNDPHGAIFVVTIPAARTSIIPPSRNTIPPSRNSLPPVFG